MSLPGCDPRRFGFACYGPDRPEENNLPMVCDEPTQGASAELYGANLFCCDFIDDYATSPSLRNDLGALFLVRFEGARPVRVEAVPIRQLYIQKHNIECIGHGHIDAFF